MLKTVKEVINIYLQILNVILPLQGYQVFQPQIYLN
jgi:hypothetical protein